MNHANFPRRTLTILLAGLLLSAPALAEKPSWAGQGKGGKGKPEAENRSDDKQVQRQGSYFSDRHRSAANDYYSGQFQRGFCPPGLAKKHNGCMPPGQAKKWSVGRPLPRDVVYYDLPPKLVTELGAPPSGHRFVRVASDILLIAVGTGMVIDGLANLGRI